MSDIKAQARAIVDAFQMVVRHHPYTVIEGDDTGLLITAITAALSAVEQRVWAEAAQRGQAMIDAYPTEVFLEPPAGQHGETVDACSARMGRHDGKVFRDWCRARAQPAQGMEDEYS